MTKKPGPKTELAPAERTRAHSVSLDAMTVRMLQALEPGAPLSKCIRRAARFAYYKRHERMPTGPVSPALRQSGALALDVLAPAGAATAPEPPPRPAAARPSPLDEPPAR